MTQNKYYNFHSVLFLLLIIGFIGCTEDSDSTNNNNLSQDTNNIGMGGAGDISNPATTGSDAGATTSAPTSPITETNTPIDSGLLSDGGGTTAITDSAPPTTPTTTPTLTPTPTTANDSGVNAAVDTGVITDTGAGSTDSSVGNSDALVADTGNGTVATIKAVIVKAAGPTPGQPAPNDPDAITSATVPNANTNILVDVLAEKLTDLGVETTIYHHFECADMSCASEGGTVADIVVLASPVEMASMLSKITRLLPALSALTPAPAVCSALASFGMGGTGPVEQFASRMTSCQSTVKGTGLQVTSGHVATDEEINTAMEAFAAELVGAIP